MQTGFRSLLNPRVQSLGDVHQQPAEEEEEEK